MNNQFSQYRSLFKTKIYNVKRLSPKAAQIIFKTPRIRRWRETKKINRPSCYFQWWFQRKSQISFKLFSRSSKKQETIKIKMPINKGKPSFTIKFKACSRDISLRSMEIISMCRSRWSTNLWTLLWTRRLRMRIVTTQTSWSRRVLLQNKWREGNHPRKMTIRNNQ